MSGNCPSACRSKSAAASDAGASTAAAGEEPAAGRRGGARRAARLDEGRVGDRAAAVVTVRCDHAKVVVVGVRVVAGGAERAEAHEPRGARAPALRVPAGIDFRSLLSFFFPFLV